MVELNHLYEEKRKEVQYLVDNPEEMKKVVNESLPQKKNRLFTPKADLYHQKLTHYKGFLKYPERLRNYIISTNSSLAKTTPFLPTIMDIEPNSRCNFRCIMCQVSEWENGKRAEDLSYDDLVTFVEGQKGLMEVKLHGIGEPLLHKDYIRMVEFLSSRDLWVRTSINGSLLHAKDNYKRIIDSGIGEIQASFDGATKEVFEGIRVKSNFEKVVDNFTLLNGYANSKERLYTRMWVLIQKRNRHQLLEFVHLAKRMGFKRLSFSLSLNDFGQSFWKKQNSTLGITGFLTQAEEDELLTLSEEFGIDISLWQQSHKYDANDPSNLCPWPFTRPYISSDLRIVPCCMISNPETYDLGNALSFNELWNGPEYQKFREMHLKGEIPDCCKGCYK